MSDKSFGFLMKAKITGDKLPDYRGTITIDGTEYELAGWIKKSKAGDSYLSLCATEKDEAPAKKHAPVVKTEVKDDHFPF
jgi:hypothetical protein